MNDNYPGNQWQCVHCKDITRLRYAETCGRCGSRGLLLISGTMPADAGETKKEARAKYQREYYNNVIKKRRQQK